MIIEIDIDRFNLGPSFNISAICCPTKAGLVPKWSLQSVYHSDCHSNGQLIDWKMAERVGFSFLSPFNLPPLTTIWGESKISMLSSLNWTTTGNRQRKYLKLLPLLQNRQGPLNVTEMCWLLWWSHRPVGVTEERKKVDSSREREFFPFFEVASPASECHRNLLQHRQGPLYPSHHLKGRWSKRIQANATGYSWCSYSFDVR